jgi:hypothetical protein
VEHRLTLSVADPTRGGLHARSVRHHPEAVRGDERWRRARERRGF